MWWPQGNCAASCCTIGSSVQASANDRMYLRLRGLKPSTPGNSVCRSLAKRSMTLVPHPSACCRTRISWPTDQYKRISSRLTAKAARICSTADAGFELLEEFRVAGGQLEGIFHLPTAYSRYCH